MIWVFELEDGTGAISAFKCVGIDPSDVHQALNTRCHLKIRELLMEKRRPSHRVCPIGRYMGTEGPLQHRIVAWLWRWTALVDQGKLRINLCIVQSNKLAVGCALRFCHNGVVAAASMPSRIFPAESIGVQLAAEDHPAEKHGKTILVDSIASASIGVCFRRIVRKVAPPPKTLTQSTVLINFEAVADDARSHMRLGCMPQIGLAHVCIQPLREAIGQVRALQCFQRQRGSTTDEAATATFALRPRNAILVAIPQGRVFHPDNSHQAKFGVG
mmetsp:Transcript_61362/g.154944  ORF Transcript_61362/g.154944 Transcript_61362/m.154944 type:complete len:272 (-) Transcript_61362:412-1227(-)